MLSMSLLNAKMCDNKLSFYASATRHCVSRPSVRSLTFITRDAISLLSGRMSIKLVINIHHVSRNCWKCFQGQRSKVKVIYVQRYECYHGGGIHSDCVASRRTCVSSSQCTL